MPELKLLGIPRFLDRGLVTGRAKVLALNDGKKKKMVDNTLKRHVNLQWKKFRLQAVEEFFRADHPDAKEPKLEPAVSSNPFGDIADEARKRGITPPPPPDGIAKAKMFEEVQQGPPRQKELPVRLRTQPAA